VAGNHHVISSDPFIEMQGVLHLTGCSEFTELLSYQSLMVDPSKERDFSNKTAPKWLAIRPFGATGSSRASEAVRSIALFLHSPTDCFVRWKPTAYKDGTIVSNLSLIA
jgi:hypothetical protein